MRVRAVRTVLVLMLGIVLGWTVAAGPGRAAPLPVVYDARVGMEAELRDPGGSLPGTNDFGCRPTAAHPRPVLLLHGSGGGRQTNWGTLAPILRNAGYCVFAPTFGSLGGPWPVSAIGGMGPKIESAWQVKIFADRVLAATGAEQLDVVGHSLGTEIGVYWLRYLGGRGKVANYVSLAPYWRQGPDGDDVRGEAIAWFAHQLGLPHGPRTPCPECVDPQAGLSFNTAVRQPTPYLPGIRYTNIVTRHDGIVTPYTNGLLPGPRGTDVTEIVLQQGCPQDHSGHLGLTAGRRSTALVLGVLEPANAPAVPCVAVAAGL